MKLNYGSLVLVAIAMPLFALIFSGPPWTAVRIAGLALATPSFLLLLLARLQLGRSFSIQAKASALVTTGLYSRIRNPIYIFGSLMIAGLILWSNMPWFLLLFVIVIPMQMIRSRKEAKVLEEKFGAAYVEYRRHTWF